MSTCAEPTMNAIEAYQVEAEDLRALVDVLRARLHQHARAAEQTASAWPHLGEALHARSLVIEALRVLTGAVNEAEFVRDLERRIAVTRRLQRRGFRPA